MGYTGKKHLVDGRWVTAADVAREFNVPRQKLYDQMFHKQVSMQVVVNMIREGLILGDQGRSERWMVDGEWTTVKQAAEMLGVNRKCLWNYRANPRNRHPDGSKPTLQEIVDHFRDPNRRRGGRKARLHKVGNRMMTTAEAAERLGVSQAAVWIYMAKHKATLAQMIRHYERKKKEKAEKAILAILTEGKP